jgi:hypothetical protein
VFARTWRARLIWSDAFSETGHIRCALYLWATLYTHRVLQGYIELDFISHPEVSIAVVEHLIQTRVPMKINATLKAEMAGFKASNKESTTSVETLESNMARQAKIIKKLQQDVKVLKR